MNLSREIRWSKTTAVLVVSMVLVIALGVAAAFAVLTPPASVTATDTKVGNQVNVTWVGSGGIGTTSYLVQFKVQGGLTYTDATTTVLTNVTVTDPGLVNGSTYVFRITAINALEEPVAPTSSNPVVPTDQTAPTAVLVANPAAPNGAGWYSVLPTYTITAQDPSGISMYYASKDSGVTSVAVPAGTVGQFSAAGFNAVKLAEATQTLSYRAVDGAGNVGAWQSNPFKIDLTNPTITLATLPEEVNGKAGWFTTVPTITLDPADAGSGVALTSYNWNALAS